ncbi:hypothetical protein BpHYR1_024974 [Brachionus plicatilis]|uniref:Uncharacterized protein n=1 Tax=Brachionus plicatilis TaxID=10195 RepID=A0A3M7S9U8_BRAPC|nr:hypothetical protein BpHYR1_024974 [Brachionus plicatilis]
MISYCKKLAENYCSQILIIPSELEIESKLKWLLHKTLVNLTRLEFLFEILKTNILNKLVVVTKLFKKN